MKFVMEPSYKFSCEIHENFTYEFPKNSDDGPYEFHMKFMNCVCWVRVASGLYTLHMTTDSILRFGE